MNDPAMEEWLHGPDGLAGQLRAARGTRLTGKQLADVAGWAASKVSRIENGLQLPSEADIDTWAAICQIEPARVDLLKTLLSGARTARNDFRRRTRRGQVDVQADYNTLVTESTTIRHFETAYVPGLLQTPDYIRRVLTESVDLHDIRVDDVDAAVAVRIQRQQALYDPTKRFEFLLAEPVLRWLLVSPRLMRAQLDRLHMAVGLPNVRFGVLPMGEVLATTPQNSFQMYDDLAIVETFVGETIYQGAQAQQCARVMERMWGEAVTGEEARRLIASAADALAGV